ncbi:MAG: NAD(P)/FAD-dependent oxidoreductase [Planctomycetota bacterium]|nr:NAD(P)/FAD-dependent oxidoreductase [Planctomycetota bacterium]MDE2215685.1 NAD(P)/FAD-dependent oxidoreductase [Planctomycetota bacterium]
MNYLIIGNGVAGTSAAKNVRDKDPSAEIKIFTQDHYPFYSRPRLPELLAKEVAVEEIYVYNIEWYYKNKIQLYLNCTVKSIDPKNQKITLADRSNFSYDKLLFATGSSGVLPPIDGINTTEGVFTLRSVEDVTIITRRAAGAKAVTLIGGGLLGLEAGNGLRKLGTSVTIVEIFDRLLPRQLDMEGAALLQKQMESMGLKFLLGAKTKSIKDEGRTKILELTDGKIIKSNFILVSAGIKPNIALAQAIGVSVNKGILVNDRMETNIPNVYAAGDVAEHKGIAYGIWPAAQRQGVVAGINMAGGNEGYMGTVPYTTLKIVGIHLTSMGDILTEDKTIEQVKVKNPDRYIYKKLFIKEGKPVAAIFLGDSKNAYEICQLIEKKVDVSRVKGKILETDFDIKSLLK